MKSRIIAVVLVAALVLCAAVVLAQRGRGMGRTAGSPAMAAPGQANGGCMMWMMGKELNLSADQLTQLKAIQKDCMDSTQSIRTDIQAKMKQMMDLWMVDQPDAGAIKDLASQLDALRMQIRNSAIDHAVSAIGVLSADQRAKLRDMMKKSPGMCMGMGCGICCGAGMGGPGMGCPMGGGMGKGMGPGGCGASCPYMK